MIDLPVIPRHQNFDRNTCGRDIVVGDIHGHFSVLEKALDEINFDSTSDRLFALGDLVDRGPESIQASEWLKQTWFHSIIGNHDIDHLAKVSRIQLWGVGSDFEYIFGDDEWVEEADQQKYRELIALLENLPVAITLTTSRGAVGLLHAEFPHRFQNWTHLVEAVETGSFTRQDMWVCTWGRYFELRDGLQHDHETHTVEDVIALFHGHSVPHSYEPFRIGNRQYIETCAFMREVNGRGGLTLVDIEIPSAPLLASWWPTSRGIDE